MTRTLLKFILLRRPVFLTDWLEAPVELKVWVFDKLSWHRGVHQVCAGWCPCGIDLDIEDAEAELLVPLAA